MLGYGRYRILSKAETTTLIRAFYAGDMAARDKLIKHNLRFVIQEARKYHNVNGPVPLDDLVQAGVVGLIHCLDRKTFDPTQGWAFLSYGKHWIKAGITRYLMTNTSEFSYATAAGMRSLFWHINSVKLLSCTVDAKKRAELLAELRSKFPKLSDGEFELGLAAHSISFFSINDVENQVGRRDTASGAYHQLKAYNLATFAFTSSSEELLIQEETSSKFKSILDNMKSLLTEKEWLVINRYILAEERETLESIGKSLGVTRERIRQIKLKALLKIKDKYSQELQELSA